MWGRKEKETKIKTENRTDLESLQIWRWNGEWWATEDVQWWATGDVQWCSSSDGALLVWCCAAHVIMMMERWGEKMMALCDVQLRYVLMYGGWTWWCFWLQMVYWWCWWCVRDEETEAGDARGWCELVSGGFKMWFAVTVCQLR